MPDSPAAEGHSRKISWKGGLYLVGPDPLTSLFYASGLLLAAGVGYASPLFIIGLYALLFVLAPIYVEAVLMTLSNGGTYNMVRTALQKLPFASMGASAVVGIITSVSYVATAIVSLLSFSHYVLALTHWADGIYSVHIGVIYSAVPSLGFGLWVMWKARMRVVRTVVITTLVALALSPMLPGIVVVMLNPVILLYTLNNQGLRESVQVSKMIFLTHLVLMGLFILFGVAYVLKEAFWVGDVARYYHMSARYLGETNVIPHTNLDLMLNGAWASLSDGSITFLPGITGLTVALAVAGVGNAILGASGVESVMQIPEELDDPKSAVPRIYHWMLSILLGFGGLVTIMIFLILNPDELAVGRDFLVSMAGHKAVFETTGSSLLAETFNALIVVDAALTLIGATNTSFAGIRGLWVTMAKDQLLPRLFLRTDPKLNTHKNIHLFFLAGVALFAISANANLEVLGHWYGGTFGLVMLSGVVGIVLLRYFQSDMYRPYRAPWDITIAGTHVPFAAFVGTAVVGGALVSLYLSAEQDVQSLRQLLTYLFVLVVIVIAYYAHPAWVRAWSRYRERILLEQEEGLDLARQRAVAVCVGGYRAYERVFYMLEYAVMHQYANLLVLHVTDSVDKMMVVDPQDTATRYTLIPGLNARRILETLSTLPKIEEVKLRLVIIPMGEHATWQESVTDFLQRTPEVHFVAIGPGESLDDSSYARVIVINAG